MDKIIIKQTFLSEIIAHSKDALPNEACGILAGRENAVERVYRMKNVHESPVSYGLDPAEQLKAMREIEGEGMRIVAIYHSHPGSPPYPSLTDIQRAFFPGARDENFPGAAYVIVGLSGQEAVVRAFLILKEGVREIEIKSEG